MQSVGAQPSARAVGIASASGSSKLNSSDGEARKATVSPGTTSATSTTRRRTASGRRAAATCSISAPKDWPINATRACPPNAIARIAAPATSLAASSCVRVTRK